MTAQGFINRAFRLTNAAGGTGEAPTADESVDGLDWLNSMIDAWGLEELTKYMLLRTVQDLTESTASYTIGTGGTINIVRPTEIRFAGLTLDDTQTVPIEVDIDVLTDAEYARWPDKTKTTTYPRGVWYDHNWSAGLGRVYPLPIPDNSLGELVLYTPTAIAEFADLTTDYTFPPGYEDAIEYNIAVRLATPFGRSIPKFVARNAIASFAKIERSNLRLVEIDRDPTIPRSGTRTLTRSQFDGGLV